MKNLLYICLIHQLMNKAFMESQNISLFFLDIHPAFQPPQKFLLQLLQITMKLVWYLRLVLRLQQL